MKPKKVFFGYIAQDEKGNPEFETELSLAMCEIGYNLQIEKTHRETYRRTLTFVRKATQ